MSAKEQTDEPQTAPQHHPGDAEEKAESEQPGQLKRSRGRPKGSTNKKRPAAESSNSQSAEGKQHRKRGRPPKNVTKLQDTEDGEPPRKKRGRPPKITTAESSAKQKGQDDDNDDNDDGADSEIQPTTSATSEFAPDGPSTSAAPIPRKRGRPPKSTS